MVFGMTKISDKYEKSWGAKQYELDWHGVRIRLYLLMMGVWELFTSISTFMFRETNETPKITMMPTAFNE
jgi:hypothetical protein